MKIYKYIGVALMVLSLGACKTDDLERDIDALKDRVTAMEAKVDRLNESMNMIRVALDGNKTIQSYTENEDGSYTLTLSDGNTITLTQGEIGATDVYQEVSISTDGNWVIGGVETEHRALDADMKAVMVYRADSVRGGYTGFDFKIRDINIAKLVDFIPSMDTIVPMLRSFEGRVQFDVAAEARLDSNMNIHIRVLLVFFSQH